MGGWVTILEYIVRFYPFTHQPIHKKTINQNIIRRNY